MERKYGAVTEEIVRELREIAGEKSVIYEDKEKLEDYGFDRLALMARAGHTPDVVVKPETTEQVSTIMRLASRENIPVTPRGAGSGLAGGAVPLYGGIVLSLEKMNRILEIDKVNRVAVAEPGVITNDLCKRALEEGLMYAGYPMSTQTSFIGANVATNAGGAKVIKYGNTRPHVLGLEVVLPSGDVIHLGGKYRKNTWGYDLLQLMIGSEGTLGIITKVTVNLLSSTGTTADLLVPFPDMKTVIDAVSEIIVSGGVLPEAVEFMDRTCMENSAKYHNIKIPFLDNDEVEAYLIIQLHAESKEELENLYEKAGEICLENGALDVFVADTRGDSENIWKVREEFGDGLRISNPHTAYGGDAIVPFSNLPEMMKELKRLEEKYDTKIPTTGHIADGNLHPSVFKPENMSVETWRETYQGIFDEITEIAVRFGGVGGGEHGVGSIKKPIFLKTKPEAELNLMRGIKKVFDPNSILNPGKII
jgi:glycolate oxidase